MKQTNVTGSLKGIPCKPRVMCGVGRLAEQGFTIIESMVVVALLGILAAIVAPSMERIAEANAIRNTAFDVVADLTLARSEAIKRNRSVTLEPAEGGWSNGWTISTDDETLKTRGAIKAGVTMDAPDDGVVFTASGRLADSVTSDTTWTISKSGSEMESRCITVMPSGSPRAVKGDC